MKKFGLPPYYETNKSVLKLETLDNFHKRNVKVDRRNVHFVQSGDKSKPTVLFIHGSPGAWRAWADYLADDNLRQNYFMIAVDRQGFGGSNNGAHEESIGSHAKTIMSAVMTQLEPNQKMLVIGHSYGGPVALRIGLDYPENTGALGLLAPSISPDLEKPQWYNKIAANAFLRKIIPNAVDHSNQEILPLKAHLEKMEGRLDEIKAPVFIIQGEEDKLVPAGNADFGKKKMVNSKVELHLIPQRGHFIPWQEYDLVKKMILKYAI